MEVVVVVVGQLVLCVGGWLGFAKGEGLAMWKWGLVVVIVVDTRLIVVVMEGWDLVEKVKEVE